MITSNLENIAFNQPVNNGGDELFIVSGFSTATFANKLLDNHPAVKLNLIVGMHQKKVVDHLGYKRLYYTYPNRFKGFYLQGIPEVHSKVYGWFKDGDPLVGYSGSPNFSHNAFNPSRQLNQIAQDDPISIRNYYYSLLDRCIEIPNYVFESTGERTPALTTITGSCLPGRVQWEIPNKRVHVSFLAKDGTLPEKSGLNWGQRKSKSTNRITGAISYSTREPNQAYLSIKGTARDEGFLPPLGEPFTLITDDNSAFDCVVAQDGRKAIESTYDNSELGKYIRMRFGLPEGIKVTKEHLEAYGRTDFTIEKITDETFLLDLAV